MRLEIKMLILFMIITSRGVEIWLEKVFMLTGNKLLLDILEINWYGEKNVDKSYRMRSKQERIMEYVHNNSK